MKIYLDCQEEEEGSTRIIKKFKLDNKIYFLDDCVAGGVDVRGEGKGCQNFICLYEKKRFKIYCEERYKDGQLERRYFVSK